MASSFSAQVKGWSEKAKRNARLVAMDAIQTTSNAMTERVPGVTLGAAFVEGKVPVGKTSGLINSFGSGVGGYQAGSPIEVALAGFDLGDSVTAGFSIEYAFRIEYGFTGPDKLGRVYNQPGRFFVRNAVQQWRANVAAAAAKFSG